MCGICTIVNDFYKKGSITKGEFITFITLLNPFAPHITEEMWEQCGFGTMLAVEGNWPTYDEAKCVDASVEIVAQVNGKIKARLNVPADISSDDAINLAMSDPAVAKEVEGKTVIKQLYVPKKLVNIVVK